MSSTRVCYLCGKEYSYCPTCGEDLYKPSWYSMYCSEVCKTIDEILAQHTVKILDIKEAKKKLLDLGIDFEKINIQSDIKKHLDLILAYEEKEQKKDLVASKDFNKKNVKKNKKQYKK